ncbi:protein panoramix [Drosophila suzukii]|uniref:Protein panoramix n=1 Tax=Drosophila suzukii TaxID=28584 RepID=A0AB39Z5B4_DROSZ
MEPTIKQEIKVENQEEGAINEDDDTPLRESTGQTPPHAFATGAPVSGCGWDSDPEDDGLGHRSAPPTPRAHLEAPRTPGANLEAVLGAIEPKAEPVIKEDVDNQVLDDILADPFDVVPQATLTTSTSPADVKPTVKLESVEVASHFMSRDILDEMDLCSLDASKELVPDKPQGILPVVEQQDPMSENELYAKQREILKELGEHDIKEIGKKNGKENSEGNGREKKKKKKHKKDRSHRSNRDQDETRKRKRSGSSEDEGAKEKHHGDRRGRKHRIKTEKTDEELDFVPVRPDEKSIRPVKFSNLSERPPLQDELNIKNLSKADKRNLAVARAELVLELFEKKANKEVAEEFHMVDTICKLPVNDSFRNQGCFENPSPICNNMNVVYEFNSTPGTRIDLAKWGLEGVPQATGKLLRLLGIDVARLKQIQSTAKPSQRILKLKKEKLEQGLEPTEELDTATLYKNAATQTERRTATHDAGTQVRLESQLKGAFWQDPKFDRMNLTQHQTNVMLALQEIYKTLPSTAVAVQLYRALQPALAIARAAAHQQ